MYHREKAQLITKDEYTGIRHGVNLIPLQAITGSLLKCKASAYSRKARKKLAVPISVQFLLRISAINCNSNFFGGAFSVLLLFRIFTTSFVGGLISNESTHAHLSLTLTHVRRGLLQSFCHSVSHAHYARFLTNNKC